jgi:diguanylate cyclase (GGDEF)-like protein
MTHLPNPRGPFAAALAGALALVLVPVLLLRWVESARGDLVRTERQRDGLSGLVARLAETESAARGYVISGRPALVERYYGARGDVKAVTQEVDAAVAGDAELAQLWREAMPALDARLATLESQVTARQSRGAAEAGYTVRRESDRELVAFDATLARLTDVSRQRAADASDALARTTAVSSVATVATGLGVVALVFAIFRRTSRQVLEVERAAARERSGLEELELRNRQISLLTELAVGLEAPSSIEEGMRTIGLFGAQVFPGTSAAVYLSRPGLDILERGAVWGTPGGPDVLDPTSCWALRRGQPHAVHSAEHDLICPHSSDTSADPLPRLCLPLAAHGTTLGLIYIRADGRGAWRVDDRVVALGRAFSEQVSLGLSSFELRETLRRQSIVDGLTGLYNRRYLDDALRREVFQAQRRQKALSVVMVDADHFKRINDIFGHDAGDVVLRAIGRELKAAVRGGDLACRFGGEEFALVLTDCGKPQALETGRRVGELIRGLHLVHGVTTLPALTISAGVATYPEDGEDAERLIAAADRALYTAKRGGRDRVEAARGVEADPIELPQRKF